MEALLFVWARAALTLPLIDRSYLLRAAVNLAHPDSVCLYFFVPRLAAALPFGLVL